MPIIELTMRRMPLSCVSKSVSQTQQGGKSYVRIILGAKTRPCKDCNQSYPVYVMDFDHVKGAKSFNLGSVTAVTVAESTLLAEIAKCDVVCANCHRIRTYGDVGKR